MDNKKRPKSPVANPIAAQKMASLWHPSMKFMSSVDGILDGIKERKNPVPPAGLRKRAFAMGLLENIKPTAEYVVILGCFPPFITPGVVRSSLSVLEKFGVDFTVLDDEVCCGWLALEKAIVTEDWEALKRAEDASKGFLKENVDAAVSQGARAMLHFCEWCVYAYNWARSEKAFGKEGQKIEHLPMLAPVLDRIDKVKLRVEKPTVVGYYEGCHARTNAVFPGIEAKIDWSPSRKVLDHIANVKVIDLPNTCCMLAADKVIENARNIKVDAIVTRCYPCRNYLFAASKKTVPVKFIPEFLDEVSVIY